VEGKVKELEKKEEQMKERERRVEEQMKEVEKKQAAWEDVERRMASNASKFKPIVNISVGGKMFAAPKTSLQKYQGSLFDSFLSSDHPLDANGIYVDRDPKYFQIVLNYLREGKVKKSETHPLQPSEIDELRQEFEYFKVPVPWSLQKELVTEGDLLRSIDHQNKMREWLSQNQFSLIYKAKRDGFAAKDFHDICDEFQGTLTVIKSKEGHLFGGFTSLSWAGEHTTKEDPSAFLFTLTNPHGIPPTKYSIKKYSQSGIVCDQDSCAAFGNHFGADIVVSSESDLHSNSTILFPQQHRCHWQRQVNFHWCPHIFNSGSRGVFN